MSLKPKCENCRFWLRPKDSSARGVCERISYGLTTEAMISSNWSYSSSGGVYSSPPGVKLKTGLLTKYSFSCSEFQAKVVVLDASCEVVDIDFLAISEKSK